VAAFAGSHRYLVEYLLEEVLSRQPEAMQSFLLATSILGRLCGPLCDALMKDEECLRDFSLQPSSVILEELERANLFVVPLDEQGEWYRYHRLFRDFLLARLYKSRCEGVAGLHRAASEWHAAHGFVREAVWHALQTQDWEYAAARVEQHGIALMLRGEISTVAEWCAAFPEAIIQAHPTLCLLQANTLVLGYRRQNRDRVEVRLQQVEQAAGALDDRPLARLLAGQAAATRTFLAAMTPDPGANPRDQFALAQRALDLLADDDPARSAVTLTMGYAHMALHDAGASYQAMEEARHLSLACRNDLGIVEAAFHQARLAHMRGQLQRAADLCRQARADMAAVPACSEPELPVLGCLDIALGCLLLEQDCLVEAEQALLQGLDRIWGMMPYYHLTACVALFRLREIQGRSAEALAFLARLEEAWPDLAFCTRALRVTHALRVAPDNPNTLADAAAWSRAFSASLSDPTPVPGMGPWGGAEAYYLACLAWAHAQIAIGRPQAALAYLARQLASAQAHGLTTRVIELSLLESLAQRTGGDDPRAWAALERSLVAAQSAGYVRIFDQGAALTTMLAAAARRGICPDFARRLLTIVGVPTTGRAGQGPESALPAGRLGQAAGLECGERGAPTERLSERELEVLRLVARGASNHAIAQQLVITVGTVKSHMNHILEKLGAHNRTEAVARAREAGLLEM
jgi:LuxR family maltose regulon positive regulatory protein